MHGIATITPSSPCTDGGTHALQRNDEEAYVLGPDLPQGQRLRFATVARCITCSGVTTAAAARR